MAPRVPRREGSPGSPGLKIMGLPSPRNENNEITRAQRCSSLQVQQGEPWLRGPPSPTPALLRSPCCCRQAGALTMLGWGGPQMPISPGAPRWPRCCWSVCTYIQVPSL